MRIQIPCMLFLLFSCCFTVNSAQACTVFTSSDGRTILFAGVENEDARWMEKVSCHFVPPNKKRHTYGYFYLFYNGNIAGGLNEKGLCFDIAGVPSHPADYGNLTPSNYLQSLLTRCATIEEAVGLLKKTCWMGFSETHLMIADAAGASVILEWLKDELHVYRKDAAWQVLTNYLITDPAYRYGPYPCPRERTAATMLDKGKPSIDSFTAVIQAVEFAGFMPLYSYIYDVKAKKIYIYYSDKYDKRITFDLMSELEKGNHSFMLSKL